MILSVSRRTDIPAYFAPWFFARLREGAALVRNPHAPHRVSRIDLSPGQVEGVVFWSKNPGPLLPLLPQLGGIPFYIQYTLNGYGPPLEPRMPPLEQRISTFLRLAEAYGPDALVWRYDPVILTGAYPVEWHLQTFARMARRLQGAARRAVFSFFDWYPSIEKTMQAAGARAITPPEQRRLAHGFAAAAHACGMELSTCAEALDLDDLGIRHGRCVDAALLSRLGGVPLRPVRGSGQRPACGCHDSIDLGLYNTCPGGCLYCYANHRPGAPQAAHYDAAAPLLCSALTPLDTVTDRRCASLRQTQLSLFERSDL